MAVSRSIPAQIAAVLLLAVMLLTSAAAVSRAASHVSGHAGDQAGKDVAALPPCHRAMAQDHLAPTAADACDTLCAGSAPEVSAERPPHPFALAAVALPVPSGVRVVFPSAAHSPAILSRGRAPPRLPAPNQRLLI